jgi:hypothetical protein
MEPTRAALDGVVLIGPVVGGILALFFNFLVQLVVRNWTTGDRERDRTYGASTRELDQIQKTLEKIQDTQMDIQKAMLKVELRIDSVEAFTETMAETTRHRGLNIGTR